MAGDLLIQFNDLGLGLVLGLSACGSGAGAGVAGMAAIGAWKKKTLQRRNFGKTFWMPQAIYGQLLGQLWAQL